MQHVLLQHVLTQHMIEHVESQPQRQPTLKELRDRAGKTAMELAEDVGVKRERTIYAWERREQIPPHDKVLTLARVLNVSLRSVYASLGFDVSGVPLDEKTETP